MRLATLGASLDLRKRDLRTSLKLQSLTANLAVPPEHLHTPSGAPAPDRAAPLLSVGNGANVAAAEVSIVVASRGSPSYDHASAQVTI